MNTTGAPSWTLQTTLQNCRKISVCTLDNGPIDLNWRVQPHHNCSQFGRIYLISLGLFPNPLYLFPFYIEYQGAKFVLIYLE